MYSRSRKPPAEAERLRAELVAQEGASRAVDIDVVVDFAGGDVASAFGAADAPTEGGLETILRECDAVAPLAEF